MNKGESDPHPALSAPPPPVLMPDDNGNEERAPTRLCILFADVETPDVRPTAELLSSSSWI